MLMSRSDDDDACHITVFLHTVFHIIAEKFVFIISRLVIGTRLSSHVKVLFFSIGLLFYYIVHVSIWPPNKMCQESCSIFSVTASLIRDIVLGLLFTEFY